MTREEAAYDRGYCDGRKVKPPLFRENRHGDIVATIDDDMADDWGDDERRAYLEGYADGFSVAP